MEGRGAATQNRSLSASQTALCQRGLGLRPRTSGGRETGTECPHAARRDPHQAGQNERAKRAAERRRVVLAPGPVVRPHNRENPGNKCLVPTAPPEQAAVGEGQICASPLSPREGCPSDQGTRSLRQHLLSVVGTKEPSWPLGHSPGTVGQGPVPGATAATLTGPAFTYRQSCPHTRQAALDGGSHLPFPVWTLPSQIKSIFQTEFIWCTPN